MIKLQVLLLPLLLVELQLKEENSLHQQRVLNLILKLETLLQQKRYRTILKIKRN